MEKFKGLAREKQIIIIGCLLTIVSVLFKWGGWGLIEETGLQMGAFLIIFALIYPLYNSYQDKNIDKKKALISLGIGLLFILYIRVVVFRSVFGYVPGQYTSIGMKMAIAGIIIAMIGVKLIKSDK